jgi:hypothetical protein
MNKIYSKLIVPLLNKFEPEFSHKIINACSYMNLLPKNTFESEKLEV